MKRMIDNKDYDNLKNSVSELDTKVNNIKDIKTITIDASQMLSESTAQLTDEQYNIIASNSFVKVVFPTAQEIGFNVLKGSNTLQLSVCVGGSNEIAYFSGNIDTTTKIVTLSFGDFSGGGKQLYQHNINIQLWNTDYGWLGLQIINDNNTPFTYSSLKQWLSNSGFSRVGHVSAMRDKGYPVVGYESDGSKKPIYNIYLDTNDSNHIFYVAQGSYGSFSSEGATNFNDIIIPL